MQLQQHSLRRTFLACVLVPALTGCGGGGGGGHHDSTQPAALVHSDVGPQQQQQQQQQQQPSANNTAGGNSTPPQLGTKGSTLVGQPGAGSQGPSTADQNSEALNQTQHPHAQHSQQQAKCAYAGVYRARLDGTLENGTELGYMIFITVDGDGMLKGYLYGDKNGIRLRYLNAQLDQKLTLQVSVPGEHGTQPLEFNLHFAHDQRGHNIVEVRDVKGAQADPRAPDEALGGLIEAPVGAAYQTNDVIIKSGAHVLFSMEQSPGTFEVANATQPGHKTVRWRKGNVTVTASLTPTSVTGLYHAEIALTPPGGGQAVKFIGRAVVRFYPDHNESVISLFGSGQSASVWINATSPAN